MSSKTGSRGGGVLIVIVILVAVALASPYYLGRQAERAYTDYLRQLDGMESVEVRDMSYRRGWLGASARYELILQGRLRAVVEELLPLDPVSGEPLRVEVRDAIRHGPLAAGVSLASVEGYSRIDGWLVEGLLDAGGQPLEQGYDARVGFDRVVRGHWHPASIELVSGPMLSDADWDARYSVEHAGGAFSYDLRRGEYQGSMRVAHMRLEDPTGNLVSEGSQSDVLARFGPGGLRALRVDTHEPLTTLEETVKDSVFTTRIEDQRTRMELGFDDAGGLNSLALHYGLERIDSETVFHTVSATGMALGLDAERHGPHAWFGGVEFSANALTLVSSDAVSPDMEASGLRSLLRLEPVNHDTLRLRTGFSADTLQLDLLDEPARVDYQLSVSELRRSGYEELWRLLYELLDGIQLEEPALAPMLSVAAGQAAMDMVGDRPRFQADPVRLEVGDASGEMALTLRVQPLALMMMGPQGLLQPGNELDLRADVGGALLEKLFRVQLRQEFEAAGVTPSDEDLEAMAQQSVAEQLQPLLMQGLLVQDGDRYRMELHLDEGRLLLNGEPADWLLQQF